MLLRTFQALNYRDFRYLWIAHLGTTMSFWMEMVTRNWLIWQMTNDPFLLGLVNLFRAIPLLVCSFPAGIAADRFDKKRVLMVSQVTTMVCHLVLATLVTAGIVEIWQVFLTAFITGAAQAFINPARQSLVPRLVGKSDLMNGIGLTASAMNISRILGPSIAGPLVGLIDIGPVYYLQGALFILVIISTSMMRTDTGNTGKAAEPILQNLGEGFSYIGKNPVILTLLLLALIPMIFAMPYMTLMPVFADEVYNIGASGMGVLSSAPGIGALIGAAAVASAGNLKRKGLVLLVGAFLFGASLVIFALSRWLPIALFALVIVGITSVAYITITNTLLLTMTPPALHGRVMSVYMMDRGLVPLGSVLAGAIAAQWSAPLAVTLMGGSCALLALGTFLASPKVRNLE